MILSFCRTAGRPKEWINGNTVAMFVIRKIFPHLTYHYVNRAGVDVSHSKTLHHFFLAIILVYSFGHRDSAVLLVFLDDIPCMANTSNPSLADEYRKWHFPIISGFHCVRSFTSWRFSMNLLVLHAIIPTEQNNRHVSNTWSGDGL